MSRWLLTGLSYRHQSTKTSRRALNSSSDWSGRRDFNSRSPPSEGGGNCRLPHALMIGAHNGIRTRDICRDRAAL